MSIFWKQIKKIKLTTIRFSQHKNPDKNRNEKNGIFPVLIVFFFVTKDFFS